MYIYTRTYTCTPGPMFPLSSYFRMSLHILRVIVEETRTTRAISRWNENVMAKFPLSRARSRRTADSLITALSQLAFWKMTRGPQSRWRRLTPACQKYARGLRATHTASFCPFSSSSSTLAISTFPQFALRPFRGFNYISMDLGQMRE